MFTENTLKIENRIVFPNPVLLIKTRKGFQISLGDISSSCLYRSLFCLFVVLYFEIRESPFLIKHVSFSVFCYPSKWKVRGDNSPNVLLYIQSGKRTVYSKKVQRIFCCLGQYYQPSSENKDRQKKGNLSAQRPLK